MANVGIYDMTDTWNNAGTAFTAIKMNVTDTASASGSKLLDIQKGGSSLLVVDKSGNMDIGGTLDVTGATTLDSTLTVTGDANFDSGTLFVDVSENNVGVGTTSPGNFSGVTLGDSILDVKGGIQVRGDATNGVAILQLGGDTYRKAVLTSSVGTDDPYLAFSTASSGSSSSATERMRIDSSGNVGIGTTSPSGSLDVRGQVRVLSTTNNESRSILLGDSSFASSPYRYLAVSWNHSDSAGDVYIQGAFPWRFFTNNTERMRIDSSGQVGIGTNSPSTKLHLQDGSPVYIQMTDAGDGAGRVGQNGTALTFGVDLSDGSTERMRITSGGEVYIAGTTDQGAYNLQCNGTGVWGQGAYVNGSDQRMKQNISELHDGLDIVMQLRPVTYQYKPEFSKDQNMQPGFIAQELQQALEGKPYRDGIVPEGPKYLNVAYQNLIPILVKALQQLEAKVAQLENA